MPPKQTRSIPSFSMRAVGKSVMRSTGVWGEVRADGNERRPSSPEEGSSWQDENVAAGQVIGVSDLSGRLASGFLQVVDT
jgi:hypothetical protein